MPITVTERHDSRPGDGSSVELRYNVWGTDDDDAARSALATEAPALHGTLLRDPYGIHVEPDLITGDDSGRWIGTVRYSSASGVAPETGDRTFSFDTTGGTQHVTQSKQTINTYAASGTAPDFQGAIGVTQDSVEGVDLVVPVFSFDISVYLDASLMTTALMTSLYLLTGRKNASAVTLTVDGVELGLAAGELLFLGASGSKRRTQNDWELSLKFSASPNLTGASIGPITGIDKKGWDYLWVRYDDAEDTTAKKIVKQPIAVYVEQVYLDGDFTPLVDLIGG